MQSGSPANIAARWLRPGVVAGMAMRLLCFAVIQGNPGIVAPSIEDTGFNALTTWHHVQKEAVRIENRVTQAYDNIRFAYQVAQRIKEIQERPPISGRQRQFAPLSYRTVRAAASGSLPRRPSKTNLLMHFSSQSESVLRWFANS